MHLTIELSPTESLTPVRRLVDSWAHTAGADAWSLRLISTELLTNAIEASPPGCTVCLELRRHSSTAEVVVSNVGHEFRVDSVEMPAPTHRRGRGLAIVHRVAESVTVGRDDGRTVVTAAL